VVVGDQETLDRMPVVAMGESRKPEGGGSETLDLLVLQRRRDWRGRGDRRKGREGGGGERGRWRTQCFMVDEKLGA
jgi:hypothetical protein